MGIHYLYTNIYRYYCCFCTQTLRLVRMRRRSKEELLLGLFTSHSRAKNKKLKMFTLVRTSTNRGAFIQQVREVRFGSIRHATSVWLNHRTRRTICLSHDTLQDCLTQSTTVRNATILKTYFPARPLGEAYRWPP